MRPGAHDEMPATLTTGGYGGMCLSSARSATTAVSTGGCPPRNQKLSLRSPPQAHQTRQSREASLIVDAGKRSDIREGRAHSDSGRLVTLRLEEGIQPHHAGRPPVQLTHRVAKHVRHPYVESVAGDHHDGIASHHPLTEPAQKISQARADRGPPAHA